MFHITLRINIISGYVAVVDPDQTADQKRKKMCKTKKSISTAMAGGTRTNHKVSPQNTSLSPPTPRSPSFSHPSPHHSLFLTLQGGSESVAVVCRRVTPGERGVVAFWRLTNSRECKFNYPCQLGVKRFLSLISRCAAVAYDHIYIYVTYIYLYIIS